MRRLTLITVGLILSALLFARPGGDRWLVEQDGKDMGSVPFREVGNAVFIDALSLCDGLGIKYLRDEMDRYVFSLPGSPVIFVPDGGFAQVGPEIVHFPVPVFREGYRLFVPEKLFLDILTALAPGRLSLNRKTRAISYRMPVSDLVEADCRWIKGGASYVFTFAYPFAATIELKGSNRLYLEIDGATLSGVGKRATGDSQLLAGLTVEPRGDQIEVKPPFAIGGARLEGPDAGNRLTLLVEELEEEGYIPMAYGDRDVSEAIEDAREQWRIDKIVIDPGHGGHDPGAVGRGKTREKDIVLDIARRLRKALRKRAGSKVVMTRDKDEFVPLAERTRIANRSGGKLFISIHCNASPDRRARGHETYFLAPAQNEYAMQVALKENSVIRYEESQEQYADLSDENFILLTMAQSQFIKESEDFAATLLKSMRKRTKLRNRGVDQAGFYVLIGASMPAVLVETAFISNQGEEKLLKKKDFRQKLADGICDAVIEFLKDNGS